MENGSEFDGSELVQELSAPAPSEPFSLFRVQPDGTRKEYKLRVRMLRSEETIACLKAAQAYAKQNGEISTEYGDIYKESQAAELIAKSLCRPEPRTMVEGSRSTGMREGVQYYPQLFTSSAQLRASFTENEIAACLNAYEVVKAKYRCTDSFEPAEIDKWAARLSDTLLGPLWLSRLDSAHWPALLMSLASRVTSLSESLGLPLSSSETSSESSPETSGSGTGGSTPSPFVQSNELGKLPEDSLLTKAEADELAKKMRK